MTDSYDALVIGGGPAGATTALLLARAGWSVVLVERKAFPRRKVCGEYLSATNLPLLDHLGIGDCFRAAAGPPVQEVGLFAGTAMLRADLPRPPVLGWGKALSRERLDTLLLNEARRAGVDVRQPWKVTQWWSEGETYRCRAEAPEGTSHVELRAPVIIAAHGSWESGTLSSQTLRQPPRPSDLFGFKAHFVDSDLPTDLMPLLSFPGGYGGMVHCEGERVSLSCCVRRDRLEELRRGTSVTAASAVLEHIKGSCRGVRQVLASARLDGPWLATGPLRPGIRVGSGNGGVFVVGNCAGEAHPVIAEGISMAIQGAALLVARLGAWREQGRRISYLPQVRQEYAARWRRAFAGRLHVAAVVATWAMRPAAVTGALPLLRCFPRLLTWGARLSGKSRTIIPTPRRCSSGTPS
jgi:2-polyprenyl-6-methoxyphenol hydroxylase-like FAD-dependent oxidoreductase